MLSGSARRGWSRSRAAIFALLWITCSTAPNGALAMPEAHVSDGPIRCRIDQSGQGSVTTLRGVVMSAVPASGTYQLRIVKHGPSGSSQISQGGRFTADARVQAGLGDVSISLESSAGFEATLILEVDGQRIACAASRRATLDL